MIKKRKIVYQEGYIKGITADKDEVINLINQPNSIIYINKVSKYDDDTGSLIITIDNIKDGTKKQI
jgi:hypothetical protein